MHDISFCKEILSALDNKSKDLEAGSAITAVNASLSPLSHVKPETLRETFKAMAKDTPYAGIDLTISTLKLGLKCASCNKDFGVDKPTFECPECHGRDLQIVNQAEFSVDSIEVAKKA